MSSSSETIAAISTPPGRGGLGIIRVSGKQSAEIYQKLIGQKPEPRTAKFVAFRSQAGDLIDKGIAIYFSAPASYTGEDVLECHVHGNESLLNILLDEIVCFGARLARPGEFTERAFLNDKLDLVQAEAVADVIDSHSKKAALAAMRSLDGVFSSELIALKQSLFQARVLIDAALDFPDEEDVVIDLSPVEKGVHQCLLNLKDLLNRARSGRQLRQTPLVVIAGPPNVGKSCVMNFLSGYESAIVSDVPGTTRDVVREHIQYEGNIYTLIDTAGIRETEDVIEKEGINRANKVINEADLVLFVYDINKKK